MDNDENLPPVDPVANLKDLIYTIAKALLKGFPFVVGGLTFLLFLIIAILMFLFQGTSIQP